MRIGTHAVADELGENRRVATLRAPGVLEHQNACALADDEPVPLDIPGPAGARGLVVAGRQGPHGREAGDAERRDAGFRAAANHGVRVAVLNQTTGIAHRVRAGRAGGRDRRIRTLGAEAHRDLPGRQVDDRGQDEERRDAFGAALDQDPVLPLDHFEPADAAADHHADALGIVRADPKTARLNRHRRGGDGELDEASALLHVLLVDPLQRVELRHLAGERASGSPWHRTA